MGFGQQGEFWKVCFVGGFVNSTAPPQLSLNNLQDQIVCDRFLYSTTTVVPDRSNVRFRDRISTVPRNALL